MKPAIPLCKLWGESYARTVIRGFLPSRASPLWFDHLQGFHFSVLDGMLTLDFWGDVLSQIEELCKTCSVITTGCGVQMDSLHFSILFNK